MSTYDTPIPGAFGSNGYANQTLNANDAYKKTLIRINQRRQDTYRQAGYLADVNPESGVSQNVRVDPYNAYGGLQSMLRNQANDFQQAQYAAEDRGLHGGLAHKYDSELKYQHGAQSAQFGSGLLAAIGGLQDEQNQAAYLRDAALPQGEYDATQQSIADQAFNPGDYSGLTYPDYGTDPAAAPPKAQQVAAKVLASAQKRVVASPVAKASQTAAVRARKAGASSAAAALAARSAGINAKYKLGRR